MCGLDTDSVYRVAAGHNLPLTCPGILGTFSVGGSVVMATSPSPDDALRLIEQVQARTPRSFRHRPALGCPVQQVFGMAEGRLNYTRLDDPDELVDVSQGRPLAPHDEVRLLDEDGRDAEVGELYTRGPYTIGGYYEAPQHNALVRRFG